MVMAVPAQASILLNNVHVDSCTKSYDINGKSAQPSGEFSTRFTWVVDPRDSSKEIGVRTGAGTTNDMNKGSAGYVCVQQVVYGEAYKIRVQASYTIQYTSATCSWGLVLGWPSSFSRSCTKSTNQATYTFTGSNANANGVRNFNLAIGSMEFLTNGSAQIDGFSRSITVTLWKSSTDGTPYSFVVPSCGTNPYTGGIHCL